MFDHLNTKKEVHALYMQKCAELKEERAVMIEMYATRCRELSTPDAIALQGNTLRAEAARKRDALEAELDTRLIEINQLDGFLNNNTPDTLGYSEKSALRHRVGREYAAIMKRYHKAIIDAA